jgi:YVTN family beta-propeller protein
MFAARLQFLHLLPVVVLLGLIVSACNDVPLKPAVHQVHIEYPAAYIVNGGDNNIAVIRLSDFAFTEVIDLNGAPYPHHIYLHPDLSMLAVAITGTDFGGGHGGHGEPGTIFPGQRVQLVDVITGDIHYEIPLDDLPHNAIFNPSGTELWVPQSNPVRGHVMVFSTTDWSLLKTIFIGMSPSEVTFSHDGTKVFVANTGSASVSVIDPITKSVLTTIMTGYDPVGAWPASNGKMYVDNEGSRTITEIDVTTLEVTTTFHLGFIPGTVAFHTLSGELWIADASNGRVAYFEFENNVWIQ